MMGCLVARRLRSSLSLVLCALACGPSSGADPVVLALGPQQVRLSEFEAHLRSLAAGGQEPVGPAARGGLFEAWVERRVLALEARARGAVPPGASLEQEEAAVSRMLAEVAGEATVTEAEVDAYYHGHPEEFVRPETVILRQVLVPTLNEAREVQRRLRKDPKSFPVLAQNLSRGPEAGAGGLMGRFARGELPSELEGPAFSVPPGETSDIIPSPLGYHVLRVEERTESGPAPLDQSRKRIRATVLAQKSERRVREFVAGLLARAKVNHEAAKGRPS
jgi:peptidyl-prolyl cis-trans isomerase C